MQTQISIDGARLVAERSHKYAGQVGPLWCGKDGIWKDSWLSDTPPVAAKVGVLRHDFKEIMWAQARFNAYCQTTRDGGANSMWHKFPEVMIAKCAEALALRKAFPMELSGLYTTEEMGQVDNIPDNYEKKQHSKIQQDGVIQAEIIQTPIPKQEPTKNRLINEAFELICGDKGLGLKKEELMPYIQTALNKPDIKSSADLTENELSRVIDVALQDMVKRDGA